MHPLRVLCARTILVTAIAWQLSACGDAGPIDDAVRLADAQVVAAQDVPLTSGDATRPRDGEREAPSDRPVASDAAVPAPSCAASPALSALENRTRDERTFVMHGLAARYASTPQGCSWQGGYAITVRFVSPFDARWRLGARGRGMSYFSAHDGCLGDTTGERLRCESTSAPATSPLDAPTFSTAMTLRAGQAVALVVNCSSSQTACVADLFAEPIVNTGCFERDTPCAAGLACVWTTENRASIGRCVPGTSPRLSEVRVFDAGVVSASVTDAEGDARQLLVELLDARDQITPHRGNSPLEGVSEGPAASAGRWSIGRGYPLPQSAVRARVWARDDAGFESERVEVPIEAPTVLPMGAQCVVRSTDPFTHISVCAPGTRCLGGDATPRCLRQTAPSVTRVAGYFDPLERALSVDIDARDPDEDITAAEILYLDAEGRELPGESFVPYSSRRGLRARREGVFGLDERAIPNGTARLRVRVGDSFGLWSDWSEFVPTPSTVVEVGGACDPDSTARRRCERSFALCVPRVGDPAGRCEAHDPACPRYWNATRWPLPSAPGTYTVTGSRMTWSSPAVSCLSLRDRGGTEYEIVAPRAGTYRFVLEGPAGASYYALALRDACGGPTLASEMACDAANATAGRAELLRTLSPGDRVMIVASSNSIGLSHRLSVTVP